MPLILGSIIFDKVWDGKIGVNTIDTFKNKYLILLNIINPYLLISNIAFDSLYYLSENKDVRDLRVNPFFHFHTRGRFEGRTPLLLINLLDLESNLPYLETDKLFHFWINFWKNK
jgi:hypothetical protein